MLDFEDAYDKGVCQMCEKGPKDGVMPHLYTVGELLTFTCFNHRLLVAFGDESIKGVAA